MTDLVNQIAKLSIQERIILVQEILATISKDIEEPSLSATQLEEIDRRSASITTGKAKTIAWEKIRL